MSIFLFSRLFSNGNDKKNLTGYEIEASLWIDFIYCMNAKPNSINNLNSVDSASAHSLIYSLR